MLRLRSAQVTKKPEQHAHWLRRVYLYSTDDQWLKAGPTRQQWAWNWTP